MKNPFKDKKSRLLIKKAVNLIVFMLVAMFLWANLHEIVHMLALKSLDRHFIYNWDMFRPFVHCTDCEIVPKLHVFYYSIAPYIVDLLAMIIGALFYKNRIMRYIQHFGYFDIFANYIALTFYHINKKIMHDFINIAKAGFWYVPIILFFGSALIWFLVNWCWMQQQIKELKWVYSKRSSKYKVRI